MKSNNWLDYDSDDEIYQKIRSKVKKSYHELKKAELAQYSVGDIYAVHDSKIKFEETNRIYSEDKYRPSLVCYIKSDSSSSPLLLAPGSTKMKDRNFSQDLLVQGKELKTKKDTIFLLNYRRFYSIITVERKLGLLSGTLLDELNRKLLNSGGAYGR